MFYYSERVQYLSISSSDFPVVSGTSFQTISIYGTHITANRKNVPAGVRFWSIQVTSQPVTLFRPPFGVTNPTIAKAVRQLGYTSIGWSIRTLDTQQSAPDKILARIRKRLKPGAIILLHDRMPGSDQIVKQILDLLKEQGYTVVRPDKLLA